MKQITKILLFGVISTLILSACAPQYSAQPTSLPVVITGQVVTAEAGVISSGATMEPAMTPATSEPAPGGQRVVTLNDRMQTITLNVGENFLLELGEMFTWQVNISDQSVLSRVSNITVVKGAQGVYQAIKPGTVTLQATGDPLCRQSKPACGMPSILFELTVVVK